MTDQPDRVREDWPKTIYVCPWCGAIGENGAKCERHPRGIPYDPVEVVPSPAERLEPSEQQVEAVAQRLADTSSLDFATACNLLRPPNGALAAPSLPPEQEGQDERVTD